MHPVSICELPEQRYLGLIHTGPYPTISSTFVKALDAVTAHNLWPQAKAVMATYFDDMTQVAPEKLRSLAGIFVDPGVAVPEGMTDGYVAGGRYAKMVYTGPYSGISQAYGDLYGTWMAQNGETPSYGPSFEIYPNSPSDTPEDQLITEIYAPLSSKP
ncbi:AraC family transcriptional regulator [Pseudoprimorskyibacter insulae]|uniref:DNA gyrase inhibitor n=1 Tax=Pseudoprimorskyibacter insulae TaxID=1695997 RepID=A0A2R8AV08_9RHOB|nr:GyrI-like domain-containing protein [Pseudoprimorskyibacter insulae]SPF79873.1 DNA gyrase inhibitor [Pseudoprimorskyibacter insulae]